jgi:hypothetical protein
VILAWLLHAGRPLTDDHALRPPRPRRLLDWLEHTALDGSGFEASAEGCAETVVLGLFMLAVLILLVLAAWFLVELVVPALALALYVVIRGMLAHVANDRHGCEGSLLRAIGWGGLWATLYTAPVALLAWILHRLLPARLG